jgi:Ca2+-transporting ATPase
LGRRIFDNLRKAMAYILAVHVPIAGLSLIPVLLKWPMVLMPVHVVFLELIIDPACSIAFEAEKEEKNIMDRPPRGQKEPLFSRNTVIRSVMQGTLILVMLLAVYGFMLQQGRNEQDARGVIFAGLVLANIGLILSNRFSSSNVIASLRSENRALWWILGSAMVLLGLVLYIPPVRSLFNFGFMQPSDLAVCFGIGLMSIIGCEVIKLIARPRPKA